MKPKKPQMSPKHDINITEGYLNSGDTPRDRSEEAAHLNAHTSVKDLDKRYKDIVAHHGGTPIGRIIEEAASLPMRGGAIRRARAGEAPSYTTSKEEEERAMAADPRYTTSEDMQEMDAHYKKQAKGKK